ncbi:MAG: hypothetical protein AAF630_05280 [Cyanobacteria bacterium P01_C01_bin.38]
MSGFYDTTSAPATASSLFAAWVINSWRWVITTTGSCFMMNSEAIAQKIIVLPPPVGSYMT